MLGQTLAAVIPSAQAGNEKAILRRVSKLSEQARDQLREGEREREREILTKSVSGEPEWSGLSVFYFAIDAQFATS